MTDYSRPGTRDVNAVSSFGVITPSLPGPGTLALGTIGCLLPAGTYYFPLGSNSAMTPAETTLVAIHAAWSATLAATFTVESCNFPTNNGNPKANQGAVDVSDFDQVAGNWIQENPTTAYVGVVGAGNTATNATVVAGGTNAGGAMFHVGNLGSQRLRLKVIVTVQGQLRVNVHGKDGGGAT